MESVDERNTKSKALSKQTPEAKSIQNFQLGAQVLINGTGADRKTWFKAITNKKAT